MYILTDALSDGLDDDPIQQTLATMRSHTANNIASLANRDCVRRVAAGEQFLIYASYTHVQNRET